MHGYLEPSPYIECRHPAIKKLAGEIGADKTHAWDRVETIYDWVREKVKYQKNTPTQSCLQTLKDELGDCDEMSSLFIALCRASGVPARMVRLPTHVYAEFYLEDQRGAGRWFPCQLAGTRAFGTIPPCDPILQKGDNFKMKVADGVSKTPRTETYRLIPDRLIGTPPKNGGGEPEMKLVCERVKD